MTLWDLPIELIDEKLSVFELFFRTWQWGTKLRHDNEARSCTLKKKKTKKRQAGSLKRINADIDKANRNYQIEAKLLQEIEHKKFT